MPLSEPVLNELKGYLRSMSKKKEVVGLKGSPGEKIPGGGFKQCCLYGWRMTGEPIFKDETSKKWKDSQGLDVSAEDVKMFVIFGYKHKASASPFWTRGSPGWEFLTERFIYFESLIYAARELDLQVMIDPVSLWLYIDDSIADSSIVKSGVQELVTTLQQIRDDLEAKVQSATTTLQQIKDDLDDLKKEQSATTLQQIRDALEDQKEQLATTLQQIRDQKTDKWSRQQYNSASSYYHWS